MDIQIGYFIELHLLNLKMVNTYKTVSKYSKKHVHGFLLYTESSELTEELILPGSQVRPSSRSVYPGWQAHR